MNPTQTMIANLIKVFSELFLFLKEVVVNQTASLCTLPVFFHIDIPYVRTVGLSTRELPWVRCIYSSSTGTLVIHLKFEGFAR